MESTVTIFLSALTAGAFALSGYLKNKSKDETEQLDWTEVGKVTLAGFLIGITAKFGLNLDEASSVALSLFVITAGKNLVKFIKSKLGK